ncbi:MAG: hypothetical protein ACKO7P_07535, partial [Bacteroidota bacterium]
MLDLLRTKVKKEFNQDARFSVNHFLVSGNYAWFMGGVTRSDGQRIIFASDYLDCCHIEALFEKDSKGNWKIAESIAFSSIYVPSPTYECDFVNVFSRGVEIDLDKLSSLEILSSFGDVEL